MVNPVLTLCPSDEGPIIDPATRNTDTQHSLGSEMFHVASFQFMFVEASYLECLIIC